ncbi:MAG TPA: HAD family phosphatase [Pirellulales bacterium]|jgi:beta-phosphoglucomutase family hydrolase|nr:HAD family phosphatase [Pirellulales bacterium]
MAVFPADYPAAIPERFKGLIFDCDGTLADTMPLHYLAWKEAMDARNIHFPEERFYAFSGMPTVTIIETLAKEQNVACDAQAAAEEKERLFLTKLALLEPVHCVVEIVHREKGRRKLAVASGGWKSVINQTLAAVGLTGLFDAIVGADDVQHGKPAPDIFLKAAECLQLQPAECLVYEDGNLGIEAAKAAGMQVIDVRPWYLPKR